MLFSTAADKSKLYGAANPALTGALVGLQNSDAITASYSTSATTASSVGTYSIVPEALDSTPNTLSNYDLTLVNGTLTVGKAPLTITAADKSKLYGAANPALTGALVGLQNSDAITASYSSSATTASSVGTFSFFPTPLSSDPNTLSNYDLTLVNG